MGQGRKGADKLGGSGRSPGERCRGLDQRGQEGAGKEWLESGETQLPAKGAEPLRSVVSWR